MLLTFVRQYKKIFVFVVDILVIILVSWLSFLVRFDGYIPPEYIPSLYRFTVLTLLVSLPIFYWQRLYHFTWAYVSINELYRIIKAISLATVLIAAILLIFRDSIFRGFPRSIVLINYFFTLLIVGGLRAAKRIYLETFRKQEESGCRLLIVGASEAGEQLARSILKTAGYNLIGFVDDAQAKQETSIHGRKVLGKRADLPEIIKNYSIEEIIIALPSAEAKVIRETVGICREVGLEKIKIIPSFREIIDGRVSLANVHDVSIEDLLGRSPVRIDTRAIKTFIAGKRVLVTGAAGSIGSKLCREILQFSPKQLVILDQNETGVFYLKNELENDFPQTSKIFEISDICDEKKIDWLFSKYRPEIVFHAAAYKHVPLMELYPDEAVKNNIFGTLLVAQATIKSGVEKFVFISTDKAINPVSVMGATKQVGEMICQWLNKKNSTKFCAVRFGNVLDSQGNVIGLFEKQIKRGGPVEVTHPEMKRYFMVTAEACLLVMQAAALSQGGEVFVLDMGEPIKIIDLAKEMVKLAGYQPDIDIPIVFTQPRPGEKLFEELLTDSETPTKHEKIFVAKLTDFEEKKLLEGLKKLKNALQNMEKEKIIDTLRKFIPTYQPKAD